MSDKLSNIIAEKISSNQNERIVIQYGIHQLLATIVNFLTIFICGILWEEVELCVILFVGIFILRPYAGGYHANTEFKCYAFSMGMINIAMIAKKKIILSGIGMINMYIGFALLIFFLSPSDNPIHLLTQNDRECYKKKTRMIILCYSIIFFLGMIFDIEILSISILYVVIIIGISILMGKWKYRKQTD